MLWTNGPSSIQLKKILILSYGYFLVLPRKQDLIFLWKQNFKCQISFSERWAFFPGNGTWHFMWAVRRLGQTNKRCHSSFVGLVMLVEDYRLVPVHAGTSTICWYQYYRMMPVPLLCLVPVLQDVPVLQVGTSTSSWYQYLRLLPVLQDGTSTTG